MTEIEEWAKKNMFISIFTVIHNNRIEWSAGVRVGMDNKNTWLPSKDEGCQFSSFLTPESASEPSQPVHWLLHHRSEWTD